MWFEILKKDLTKQKSVNIILFLFITKAAVRLRNMDLSSFARSRQMMLFP